MINKQRAKVKAKIYTRFGDHPVCWFNFDRTRDEQIDKIVEEMAKRIEKYFGKQLNKAVFYTNNENPAIGKSTEIATLTYYDGLKFTN